MQSSFPPNSHKQPAPAAGSVAVGDWVRVERFKACGEIVRIGENGRCQVAAGQKTYECFVAEVVQVPRPPEPPRSAPAAACVTGPTPLTHEINLHDMTLHEALRAVQTELDHAAVGVPYRVLRIVHGVGAGVLAQRVHELLRENGISRFENDPNSLAATLVVLD